MSTFTIQEPDFDPVFEQGQITDTESAQSISFSKLFASMSQEQESPSIFENYQNIENLECLSLQISQNGHQCAHIDEREPEEPSIISSYEVTNTYNGQQSTDDQKPFNDDNYEYQVQKKTKKSSDGEYNFAYKEPQEEKKSKKSSPKNPRKNIKTNPKLEDTLTRSNLPHLDNLSLKNVYSYTKNSITIEVKVGNLPSEIEQLGANESKNFLKSMGDFFLDNLYGKKILSPAMFKKDCLHSLPIWNSLFNPEDRTKFESKEALKKIMKGLKQSEISSQSWLSLFLEFCQDFNPSEFRYQEKIENPERRVLYEVLSIVMIEGAKAIKHALNFIDGLEIVSFKINRVHKLKGSFSLQTKSPQNDKQLVRDLNQMLIGVPQEPFNLEYLDNFNPANMNQAEAQIENLQGNNDLQNPGNVDITFSAFGNMNLFDQVQYPQMNQSIDQGYLLPIEDENTERADLNENFQVIESPQFNDLIDYGSNQGGFSDDFAYFLN